MTMNIDVVKNVHSSSFANTEWEEFIAQLEKGLDLIENIEELPQKSLAEMKAANIALSYNRELMMHNLMSM